MAGNEIFQPEASAGLTHIAGLTPRSHARLIGEAAMAGLPNFRKLLKLANAELHVSAMSGLKQEQSHKGLKQSEPQLPYPFSFHFPAKDLNSKIGS